MIRTIPGDIFEMENKRLLVTYFDNNKHKTLEETFDLVVLSVGLVPGEDTKYLSEMINIQLDGSGYFSSFDQNTPSTMNGIFIAGTAQGPMGIAETITCAGNAAWETVKYLEKSL